MALITYPRTQANLSAANSWTDPLLVGEGDVLIIVTSAAGWSGILTVQSRDGPTGSWDFMGQIIESGAKVLEMPVSGRYVRVGFQTGEYTSGTVNIKVAQG